VATHQFVVNVPNPSDYPAIASLSLREVAPATLRKTLLECPEKSLKVTSATICLKMCAINGERSLRIPLKARESADIYVQVVTEPSSRPGIVALQLVDTRADGAAGGTLLVVADPPLANPVGRVVTAPRPCPVVLAGRPYFIVAGADPAKSATGQQHPDTRDLELVVPVKNATSKQLHDVQVYLEHTGLLNAQFAPRLFNVGTFAPAAIFYSAWRFIPLGPLDPHAPISVVVASRRCSPVRLNPRLLRLTEKLKLA
jgi:hypothetical protein